MNKTEKIFFFTGKGGVGKSTVSALCALHLANSGKSTLLVSLDPAHNLQDIFKKNFSEKENKVLDNLFVIQVNTERQIDKYLQNTIERVEQMYQYQSAFGMKNYFKILKKSPGLEEYAIVQAFIRIVENNQNFDHLIFDMPPTALTMRFFNMPANGLLWINELSRLRKAIIEKHQIISKVKFGKKEIETDKVSNQLSKLKSRHEELFELFKSVDTKINVVLNPDELSVNEALNISQALAKLKIKVAHYVLNKNTYSVDKSLYPFDVLPISYGKKNLTGIENLQNFLSEEQTTLTINRCIK